MSPALANMNMRRELNSDQLFLTEMDLALKQMCDDVKLQKGLRDHLVTAENRFLEEKLSEFKSNA
jgi:DTW domain-containing protein YfiP